MYSLFSVSCFCLFVQFFIDNYVSCHVFLVSSGVRQLLFRAKQKNSAQGDKQARGKTRKQKAKSNMKLIEKRYKDT